MFILIPKISQIIKVSDDVYKELKRMKEKESYSTVIRTLFAKKTNKEKILAFFGKEGIDKVKALSHTS